MRKTKLQKLKLACEKLAIQKSLESNNKCLICKEPATTAHHFFPKSISANLRCDLRNLIPICNSCHFVHHQKGDPRIHQTIIRIKGTDWFNDLLKDSTIIIHDTIGYWTKVLKDLSTE